MSDDGEPAGTAGPPTLAVLQGSDLGDACLVTTRFFGGTKLGTGGLVRAYGDAARAVLAEAPTEMRRDWVDGIVRCPYAQYESLRRLLEQMGAQVDETLFAADVELRTRVEPQSWNALSSALEDASAGLVHLVPAP
jgi:uncharacterized YigZ family protein